MKISNMNISNRRQFLQQSSFMLGSALFLGSCMAQKSKSALETDRKKVNGHLWVYASKFPPNWDCTPNLESVFSDLSYAGIDGVELMESTLRYSDYVKSKIITPEKIGFRTREKPLWGKRSEGEDGGIWFSLEGSVIAGVATFDKKEAKNYCIP